MKKDIMIGEKVVPMGASALTPFSYKKQFGRDLIKDFQSIQKSSKNGELDAEIVAEISYTMAKEANKDIEPFEEWLEGFEMFDLYMSFGDIVQLWGLNEQTHSKPAKK